jgi:alkylated DNA repair dioxygenase AlkB
MQQLSFFEGPRPQKRLPEDLLYYLPGLFTPAESELLMNVLIETSPWQQHVQRLYDKEVKTPRLTSWYGDTHLHPELLAKIPEMLPWTPELTMIRKKVEPLIGEPCNCVLLNYYRDGNDSVAWHSDRESTPGKKTIVGSVSFGQVRSFDIRNKYDHAEKYSIRLEHGSFLLMKAGFQDAWEHRVAKSSRPMKGRLNLTFRTIGG